MEDANTKVAPRTAGADHVMYNQIEDEQSLGSAYLQAGL